jgi:ABC-type multidrug transport system permease subunit
MSSSLFRFIAGIGRDMVVSQTFGPLSLLAFTALGGFILARPDVKKWWIWGYWISPLSYAQNAISTNEFLGRSWNKVSKDRISHLEKCERKINLLYSHVVEFSWTK